MAWLFTHRSDNTMTINNTALIYRNHPQYPHTAVLVAYSEVLWVFPPTWTDDMIFEAINFANSRYIAGIAEGLTKDRQHYIHEHSEYTV